MSLERLVRLIAERINSKAFQNADKNSDGEISRKELFNAMRALGESDKKATESVEMIFQNSDDDGSASSTSSVNSMMLGQSAGHDKEVDIVGATVVSSSNVATCALPRLTKMLCPLLTSRVSSNRIRADNDAAATVSASALKGVPV